MNNMHEKFMEDLAKSLIKAKAAIENADIIVANIEEDELNEENYEIAKICGSKTLPIDDRAEWDGAAARARIAKWAGGPDKDKINWKKYGKGFVWVVPGQEDTFGGYKLPFADVINGELKATWGGVSNAMKAVRGARRKLVGVDVKKAYNFLAAYYKKFKKEVPK